MFYLMYYALPEDELLVDLCMSCVAEIDFPAIDPAIYNVRAMDFLFEDLHTYPTD